MTNTNESTVDGTSKDDNPAEDEVVPANYFDEPQSDQTPSIYPDDDLSPAENKFFGNKATTPPRPRKGRTISVFEKRRRVKLQARRVRRIIRHIEVWSVLKFNPILGLSMGYFPHRRVHCLGCCWVFGNCWKTWVIDYRTICLRYLRLWWTSDIQGLCVRGTCIGYCRFND